MLDERIDKKFDRWLFHKRIATWMDGKLKLDCQSKFG